MRFSKQGIQDIRILSNSIGSVKRVRKRDECDH